MTRTFWGNVDDGSIRDDIVFLVFEGPETGVFENLGSDKKVSVHD